MALEEQFHNSGFVLPPNETARKDVFQCLVSGFVNSGKNRQLKMMVVGEAGQGKSTLINALVGKELAKEGDQFKAGTLEIQQYSLEQNGVEIKIWDTPGFGLGRKRDDDKLVERLMRDGCNNVDLALFCVRMDTMRFPTRVHSETITKLTQVFGKGFWKYCLFVLTFANNVQQFCPPDVEMEEYFSQRCEMLENQIKVALQEDAELEKDIVDTVRAVPVGSHRKGLYRENQWALPDREDWFIMFWIECTDHMHKSALSALLRANYHRLEAGDALQSSMGPAPQFDPQDRLLTVTTEEKSEVRIQMDNDGYVHVPQPSLESLATSSDPVSTRQRTLPSATEDETLTTPLVTKPDIADLEKGIYDREVPLYETLRRQLENNQSGFYEYVATFVKERAKDGIPVLGHIRGFVEGLRAYLSSGSGDGKDKTD